MKEALVRTTSTIGRDSRKMLIGAGTLGGVDIVRNLSITMLSLIEGSLENKGMKINICH